MMFVDRCKCPERKVSTAEICRKIRIDLEAELDAINLYESHLEVIDDEEIRKVFKHVIKEEQEHVEMFAKLLKKLDPGQMLLRGLKRR